MRSCKRRAEFGFTLVELLVVIAILGVISLIAVVSFGGFSQSTSDATCAADRKSLSSAEDAAIATNGVYGSEAQLVAGKLLKEAVSSFDVVLGPGAKSYSLTATGSC